MGSITVPQAVLNRIGHLAGNGEALVPELFPGLSPFDARVRFSFLCPTVIYPVAGSEDRYLIAMFGPGASWTLIGVDHLACHIYCDDPECVEVRDRLAAQRAELPPDGMLFARTYVDADGLSHPNPTPYLIHIDDFEHFSGEVSLGTEIILYGD